MIEHIFMTPIARYDLSEHIDYLRNQFPIHLGKYDHSESGFKTTFPPVYNSPSSQYRIIDLMGGKNDKSINLYSKIKDCALDFSNKLCMSNLNTVEYDFSIREFWYNEMTSGQYHRKHIHPGRCFAAVIYVDMPENCAGITFDSPSTRFDRMFATASFLKQEYSMEIEIVPKQGEMIMWEAWIPHQVKASTFEGIRRCVGIDLELQPRITLDI